MKWLYVVWILVALSLAACQASPSSSGGTALQVEIRFPSSVARGTRRHSALVAAVTHLRLVAKTKSGVNRELAVAPEQWNSLSLEGIDFPKGESDRLELTAEIWGRHPSKRLPLLQGTGSISGEERRAHPNRAVVITLKFGIALSEWNESLGL